MSPDVEVAIVSAIGGTAVAAMTAVSAYINKRGTKQLDQKVGNPNGYGNISTMLELVIDNVKSLHARMDALETERRIHIMTAQRMAESIKSIEERLS